MQGHLPADDLPRRRGRRRGSGVGGGSLGYANTLYRAPERFYARPAVGGARRTGASALAPHFDTAERMLGVVTVDADDPADQLLREFGAEIGAEQHLRQDARRRLLRHAGRDGAGPVLRRRRPGADRLHRLRALHGRLPAQRQEHAAEELPLARRARGRDDRAGAHGRRHPAARRARRLGRLRGHDASAPARGCAATAASTRPAASSSRPARSARTGCSRAPSCAARCRASPTAWASSCGRTRRRSSPSRSRPARPDMTKRVAISSSVYPDPDTHIETVTYGDAGDSMSALYTLLVGDGTRLTRPLKLLGARAAPPAPARQADVAARLVAPDDHRARDAVARQRDRAARAAQPVRRRPPDHRAGPRAARTRRSSRSPTSSPSGWRERTGGIAQSSLIEALANIPTTAHILGGAVIGADRVTRRRRRASARLRL